MAQESRQIEAVAKSALDQIAVMVTVNNSILLPTIIIITAATPLYMKPGTFPSTSNIGAHLVLVATLRREQFFWMRKLRHGEVTCLGSLAVQWQSQGWNPGDVVLESCPSAVGFTALKLEVAGPECSRSKPERQARRWAGTSPRAARERGGAGPTRAPGEQPRVASGRRLLKTKDRHSSQVGFAPGAGIKES